MHSLRDHLRSYIPTVGVLVSDLILHTRFVSIRQRKQIRAITPPILFTCHAYPIPTYLLYIRTLDGAFDVTNSILGMRDSGCTYVLEAIGSVLECTYTYHG